MSAFDLGRSLEIARFVERESLEVLEKELGKMTAGWDLSTPDQREEWTFYRILLGALDGLIRVERLDTGLGKLRDEKIFEYVTVNRDKILNSNSADWLESWIYRILEKLKLIGGAGSKSAEAAASAIKFALRHNLSDLIGEFAQERGDRMGAMFSLLDALEGIKHVRTKKALILLRDLDWSLGWGLPVEYLPLPLDTHTERVMYRTGLSPSKDPYVICAFARMLFERPVYADIKLWRIGKDFCEKQKPKCEGCELRDLCPKVGVR